jgi:prepilin-type N-terminal cleavage/methylation domain-containing protein
MRRLPGIRRRKQRGFTLIEVLVVIAIIAVLMSMVAAGVFQYQESQKQANTEATMRALSKALAQQVDAVLRAADKEVIPLSVQNLATANGKVPDPQNKRARVIWKKLRLKQEFPMSFSEALTPLQVAPGNYFGLQKTDLPAKTTYLKVLQAASPDPGAESSILLLLALQQKRGGTALPADALAPTSTTDSTTPGLKKIVDGWGNPLAFYRFPAGPPFFSPPPPNTAVPPYYTNDLDRSKPFPSTYKLTFRDPVDPEGTLVNPQWNNYQYFASAPNNPVAWYEQLCHNVHWSPVPNPSSQAQYNPASYYMMPVIVSPGRDGSLGLNTDMSPTNEAMPTPDTFDNLFSFRLRLGAQGN